MLVTPERGGAPSGGRDMLAAVHCRCLEALLGEDLLVQRLDRGACRRPGWAANALRGYIDGVDAASIEAILAAIRREQVDRVYLDGSNLGVVARAVKKEFPHTEILTFFHNVEARFFLGSLKRRKSLRAAAVLMANYVAERNAVRHSDRRIALSERDSRLLKRLYGRGASDILPLAMEDALDLAAPHQAPGGGENYALFVGGAFYANEAGIRWFAEKVAPAISIRTCVVGRGMERLRRELERHRNVELVGAADRLTDWYLGAKVVIAPIFDGSGMKTKIAEALMFGKKIVGTSEAFAGYEDVAGEAGWVCDTKEGFVSTLRMLENMPLPAFDPKLRSLYESRHSSGAALRGLSHILGVAAETSQEGNG